MSAFVVYSTLSHSHNSDFLLGVRTEVIFSPGVAYEVLQDSALKNCTSATNTVKLRIITGRNNTLSAILTKKTKTMMTNRLSRTPTHVVKDADSSNDAVDDLEYNVTHVVKV